MNDIIKNHRKFVANQIEKSFDGGINVPQELDIEKAKWKVGDEKQYQGATWVVGGFNAKGVPLWRKKKDSGAAAGGSGSATPAKSTSEKSWDKQDSFNRRGTDENKLWNLWYHHQNTGDPFHVSAMVDILKKKFPNVAEFVQTAPNTSKSTITAKDSSGNEIATIDLSGNKTSIPTLQTFMDKCSAAVKAPANKTPEAPKSTGNAFDFNSGSSDWEVTKKDWQTQYRNEKLGVSVHVDKFGWYVVQNNRGYLKRWKTKDEAVKSVQEAAADQASVKSAFAAQSATEEPDDNPAAKEPEHAWIQKLSPKKRLEYILDWWDDETVNEDEFTEALGDFIGSQKTAKKITDDIYTNPKYGDDLDKKREVLIAAVSEYLGIKSNKTTSKSSTKKSSSSAKGGSDKKSDAISKFVDKIFELKEASEKAESEYKVAAKKYNDEFSETDEFKNFEAFQTKVAGMDDEEYKKYWDEEDKLLAAYQKKDKEIQDKYNVPQLEREYYHVADKKYRDHFFEPNAYDYMKTLMDKKDPSEKEKEAIELYTKAAWNPD